MGGIRRSETIPVLLRRNRLSHLLSGVLVLTISALSSLAHAREHGRVRDRTSVTGIILHSIGGPACIGSQVRFMPIPFRDDDAEVWRRFLLKAPVADAHFVIGRSGVITSVIPTWEVANHAVGVNDESIGIELVNRGDGVEPFPDGQIDALVRLIRALRIAYPVPAANIRRHSDVDQRTCLCGNKVYLQRQDPGPKLPLADILARVFDGAPDGKKAKPLAVQTGPASPSCR